MEVLRHAGIRIEELLERTQHGRTIPLIQRYDNHERRMSGPMPFLFQRHTGAVPRVISPATVLVMLRRRCAELAEQHASFRATSFTPHDLRRLLATDLVNEHKSVTNSEWSELEEHFDRRKVELGGCTRPYGSPCRHEHSCLRCPMLATDPKMLPRLDEIEDDLLARRARAEHEAWLGEVEGIDLTRTFLRRKRDETKRPARIAPVALGMPAITTSR